MIYLDKEYYERLIREEGIKNDPPNLFLNREECFDLIEDEEEYHDDFDIEAYNAARQKFIDSYIEKAILVTLDFYPRFRSKRKELKELLLNNADYLFETVYEIHGYYIEGGCDNYIEEGCQNEISINYIDRFLHNSNLDYLLENYDEWYKRKISFENIYMECFYASVYIKTIHKLIISTMHNFYPVMTCLPSEQLDNIYANLINDASDIYFTIVQLDPDELNESSVFSNLEDYEFEDLIKHPGPEIIRNTKGRIISVFKPEYKPNPAKVPLCCRQCKSFYNSETYILCTVSRVNQKNSEFFSCRAYEKIAQT